MQKNNQYDAFISYRHHPRDMKLARQVMQRLERHKDKTGRRLRIFRDQSELPTSSDLGHDIRDALANSRFLIVICSPEYQQSKWCMEELRYFRSLHDDTNYHILPILVEGEPEDVFPQELLWERETLTRRPRLLWRLSRCTVRLCCTRSSSVFATRKPAAFWAVRRSIPARSPRPASSRSMTS